MNELRHLQLVLLDIIKDIDKLCKEHDITYYLLGGSAIGAVRHNGFIPWDDDLDIILPNEDYNKFIRVCKSHLDLKKYYFQEGLKDWPLYFSKIKLRGTRLVEHEAYTTSANEDGIFIDVFKMDNVANNSIAQKWQYLWGKYYLCYQLSQRTYKHTTFKNKLLMLMSFPLKCKVIRQFAVKQVERFNIKSTDYYGFFYGRTRFKSAIYKKEWFGKGVRHKFEDTELPIAEKSHEYLSQVFGDYMKLPPEEQRKGLHLISVDFGNY